MKRESAVIRTSPGHGHKGNLFLPAFRPIKTFRHSLSLSLSLSLPLSVITIPCPVAFFAPPRDRERELGVVSTPRENKGKIFSRGDRSIQRWESIEFDIFWRDCNDYIAREKLAGLFERIGNRGEDDYRNRRN